jgi:hypothetical protein
LATGANHAEGIEQGKERMGSKHMSTMIVIMIVQASETGFNSTGRMLLGLKASGLRAECCHEASNYTADC